MARGGYSDPIIQKVISFLDANGPKELKGKYIQGDVMNVPKSQLPVCTVARENTQIMTVDNMEDGHLIPLVINVIADQTKDLQQNFNLEAGTTTLYKLVEARDPLTYHLLPNTLLYWLSKGQQIDNKFWLRANPNESVTAEYGLGVNRRGPGIYSVEAAIRVNATLHLPMVDYY